MDQEKQSLIDRIKQASNILVTVSKDPNVDQLAAAIGLTLALNKMDKRGTTVFSGQVPNAITFLKPEDTIRPTADSLRDFIIALDKAKADRLRYKVEDDVVRIYITPYRTELTESDLNFSQGDYNVDVVLALGVSDQGQLDDAITAHGRILHDATVASVSLDSQNKLGTLNWADTTASSLSEMALSLVQGLDSTVVDAQIATALLTGIVASTDRFRNEKTSPAALTAASALMAAGANQQLIASELESPTIAAPVSVNEPAKPGEVAIDHDNDEVPAEPATTSEDTETEPPAEAAVEGDQTPLLDTPPVSGAGIDEDQPTGIDAPTNTPLLAHDHKVLSPLDTTELPEPPAPEVGGVGELAVPFTEPAATPVPEEPSMVPSIDDSALPLPPTPETFAPPVLPPLPTVPEPEQPGVATFALPTPTEPLPGGTPADDTLTMPVPTTIPTAPGVSTWSEPPVAPSSAPPVPPPFVPPAQ